MCRGVHNGFVRSNASPKRRPCPFVSCRKEKRPNPTFYHFFSSTISERILCIVRNWQYTVQKWKSLNRQQSHWIKYVTFQTQRSLNFLRLKILFFFLIKFLLFFFFFLNSKFLIQTEQNNVCTNRSIQFQLRNQKDTRVYWRILRQ